MVTKLTKDDSRDGPEPGYVVYADGSIWSHRSGKWLTPYKNWKGYLYVDIDRKPWPLSHVVWYAFFGYRPKMIKFANKNKEDVAIWNLIEFGNTITYLDLEDGYEYDGEPGQDNGGFVQG